MAALAVLASVVLGGIFLAENPGLVGLGGAAFLLLYLFLFHIALFGALGLAIAALLSLVSGPTALSRAAVMVQVLAVGLAAIVALNSGMRFTLTYTLVSGSDVFVTPIGLLDLLVFGATVPVALLCVLAWFRPGLRNRAVQLAGAYGAVFALTVLANLHDERPAQVDLSQLAPKSAPLGPPPWDPGGEARNVLVLGLDALSWQVLGRMFGEGELPHFRMLVEHGVRGNLQTEIPTLSPVLWTTIATGRQPTDHGVYGFTRFRLPGMRGYIERGPLVSSMNWWNGLNRVLAGAATLGWVEQSPFFSSQRRVPAVWDVARHHGIPVGVSRWWITWPVVPLPPASYMVSDYTGRPGSLSPEKEIEAILSTLPSPPEVLPEDSALRREPSAERQWRRHHEETYRSLALYRRFKPRLVLDYSHFVDQVQHRYWRGNGRDRVLVTAPADVEFAPHVRDAYRVADDWLGAYLGSIEPDTVVLVVSDHGYSFDGHEHHQAPDGVFLAAGPGIREGALLDGASIYDVAPTVLALLGLPVSEELEGRVLTEIFRPEAAPSVRRVPAYAWYEPPDVRAERSLSVEREMLERLKELGYVN